MTRRFFSQRGFSLLEIILGLQLTVVLSAVAVPKLSQLALHYKLMAATNLVALDIGRARIQAIAQNRYVHLKVVSSTQYIREVSVSTTDPQNDNARWTGKVTIGLPRGVTVDGTTISAEIRFDPKGVARVRQPLKLTNGISPVRTIDTNILGRVSIG